MRADILACLALVRRTLWLWLAALALAALLSRLAT